MMMQTLAIGVAALAAISAASCYAAPLSPQNPPVPPPPQTRGEIVPRLTVRGEAQLDKPADQLQLRLGLVTQAAEAAQAIQENNRTMEAVVAAITKLGLDKKEYQTSRFNVQPQYGPPPRNPSPDWRPQIVGYQVNNTILVKTTKLEKAGDIIQAATDAGANSVESIYFDLADPRKHRAEAIQAATQNAISDANALAQASGQKLVRVLTINLDDANAPQPVYREEMMGVRMASDMVKSAPPINPGDITIHASVTLVYEIAPLH